MTKFGKWAAVASMLFLVSCAGGSSGPRAPVSPKGALAPPPPPMLLQSVNLIVFPGGFNWPIWVAQEKGFFAQNGIEVKVTPTPNSVFQITNLIDGKFDIAMTAIDNLIAYREGQGEAPKQGPDLFAFMGGDNGFLRLVTVPEVQSYRELRGKTLSVDALTTGYAFVLFEILARNKMQMGKDYKVVTAGGVLQRFQALMEKKHAGTLLLSPFEVQAEEKGFHRLANASDVLGRYQGLVGGARKSWAAQNRDAVIGYIRGFSDAVDWLYDPANRDEAIAIFRKNLPNATPQAALVAFGILLNPVEGFQKKAKIDLEGVKTVLALRTKYAKPHKTLKDPAQYYDPSFYDAAMQR
jgi:ABC-type nitrate/sulfonate/bicarbonate transport system substrate-binding protein